MNVSMRVMDDIGRQTGASEDSHPRDAWVHLGALLRQRRGQIDVRYRHRNVFADEVRLKESLLADIENAKRTTFTDATLAAIEVAYRLAPGSIRYALEHPELEEFPHRLRSGEAAAAESAATGEVQSEPRRFQALEGEGLDLRDYTEQQFMDDFAAGRPIPGPPGGCLDQSERIFWALDEDELWRWGAIKGRREAKAAQARETDERREDPSQKPRRRA